jgi:hypothetical protein
MGSEGSTYAGYLKMAVDTVTDEIETAGTKSSLLKC